MTREEAITALGDRNNLLWGMSKEEQKYYSEALDMAISALSKNKGEWKPEDERLTLAESLLFRCSKCNIIFGHQTNFCPNCGCDMRIELGVKK